MEAYSMAEKYGQHASGEVGGVIKLTVLTHFAARSQRAYPILVAPQQLKKFATGNGNTKKELITKEVLKRWGVDFDDTNLAEAYVLARIAHAVDTSPEMTQFQADVVKNLAGRTECPTGIKRRRLVRVGGRGSAMTPT
jgi:crossover junction endodeoxyribonuclease RuvC